MLDLKWWGVAYGCDDVTYWSVFLSLGIDDPTGVQSELKRFPKGYRVCVTLSVCVHWIGDGVLPIKAGSH